MIGRACSCLVLTGRPWRLSLPSSVEYDDKRERTMRDERAVKNVLEHLDLILAVLGQEQPVTAAVCKGQMDLLAWVLEFPGPFDEVAAAM
jgi:hypothetical protein